MTLTPGARLGVYEITVPIGEGGMGQVFRARDTRLDRDVAIKILPEAFAHDADRLARFQREAKTLASLNHPNIAGIHGLEESGRMTALVMELVVGDDLSQRIARGAIPIEEVLSIAKQIADALEAAHGQGIVHRDLKPANIKVRSDGMVKVLDFGLAKTIEPMAGSSPDMSQSPTITTPVMTQAGVILGTAAYMSPEQAKGKAVERRSDVWAFGAVLYEMLTGTRAFAGEDVTDTIVAILSREPDWKRLPSGTPSRLRELLRRCLEKDVSRRLQAIGEARIQLGDLLSGAPDPVATAIATMTTSRRAVPVAIASMLAGALLAGAAAGIWILTHPTARPAVVRFTFQPPQGFVLSPTSLPAVSPDGSRIAFVLSDKEGRTSLWTRALDALAPLPVAGTEDASLPFWSPDSSQLGFFAGGKLKRVAPAGGPVRTVCDVRLPVGGAWGKDGVMLYGAGPRSALYRVSSAGGTPTPATVIAENAREAAHAWPSFMPDGEHFLYLSRRNPGPSVLGVQSLTGSDVRRLNIAVEGRTEIQAGYLLYESQGRLVAHRFDARRLETIGEPVPIVEDIGKTRTNANSDSPAFSISASGVLAYASLGEAAQGSVVVVGRDGAVQRTIEAAVPGDRYTSPAISPDGARLALALSGDIWVIDLTRGTRTRLSFDSDGSDARGANVNPIWARDGQGIVYTSHPKGVVDQLIDLSLSGNGSKTVLPVQSASGFARPQEWSPDGRYVAYVVRESKTLLDVWLLDTTGERPTAKPFLVGPGNQGSLRFSPDGQRVAYESDETGRPEVFVQAFPTGTLKHQVSLDGGSYPRWSRDGKELFWIAPDGKLTATSVEMNPQLETGQPVALFESRILRGGDGPYDVTADGRGFVIQRASERPFDAITVITNWTAALPK